MLEQHDAETVNISVMQVQIGDGGLGFGGSRIKLENRFKAQQFQASADVAALLQPGHQPSTVLM